MKHIAKDVYLKRDGEWSFELSRKKIVKEGKTKGSVRYDTIGYYSNMGLPHPYARWLVVTKELITPSLIPGALGILWWVGIRPWTIPGFR